MRHRKESSRLGRSGAHRKALMAALVCNLILQKRITTTLTKARLAGRLAEKMVTVGKKATLAARRQAVAELRRKDVVAKLFDEIVPQCQNRAGGYTRVLKLGKRGSDSSEMALLEWVDVLPVDKTVTKTDDTAS